MKDTPPDPSLPTCGPCLERWSVTLADGLEVDHAAYDYTGDPDGHPMEVVVSHAFDSGRFTHQVTQRVSVGNDNQLLARRVAARASEAYILHFRALHRTPFKSTTP